MLILCTQSDKIGIEIENLLEILINLLGNRVDKEHYSNPLCLLINFNIINYFYAINLFFIPLIYFLISYL